MPRRSDPTRCCRGHDLTLPGAVWIRDDGYSECMACIRDRMAKWRRRTNKKGKGESKSDRDRRLKERFENSIDLDKRLQQMVDDECLPSYLKPRKGGNPPDLHSRMR